MPGLAPGPSSALVFLIALALATGCKRERSPTRIDRIDAALEKSAAFLVSQQGDDGGFHSETYGAFKDGKAITPLVANALLFVKDTPSSRTAHQRALAFIAAQDGPYDYPVYTIAGAIMALSMPAAKQHAERRDALVAELRAHQLNAANGWSESDLAFGGFGYWHDIPRKPEGEMHELLSSNLSATLWAVGALQLAGVAKSDPLFADALKFVRRCQQQDGGFVLTPTNPVQNKAGDMRSYGSATADGIRLLARLGSPDERGLTWLRDHFDGARNVGAFPAEREFSRDGSRYYATWTIAHAFTFMGGPAKWEDRIVDELLALQRADGSFKGGTDLREDDPLVATSLAMASLALARFSSTKEWRAPLSM